MRKVTTASVMVDGLKVSRTCRDEEEASLWIRYMTAQYMGRVASPIITHTTYSDIFHTPVEVGRSAKARYCY